MIYKTFRDIRHAIAQDFQYTQNVLKILMQQYIGFLNTKKGGEYY
ncbi:MAG: hypothetical protein ACI825_000779 [Planctomycetota bacterium]|jgi:hypothetical protein